MTRSGPAFAALIDHLETRMRALRIPGVAVGVLHGDEEYFAGLGVTSLDNPLPVTPDTIFQCGSISKTILGTALMTLVEEGTLDLDAPVRRWLPQFSLRDADAAERVTLRHLLTHTGGWLGDHFNDFGFGADAIARIVADVAALPQWTPLGSTWSYNNVGFAVAALVMQEATGRAFEDIVRARVFDPLGMARSTFWPTEVMTRRFAVGHNVVGGAVQVAAPWEIGRANHPAGGVNTTVRDLLRYARMHITPAASGVLSKRAALAMRHDHGPSTGRWSMGLTWWMSRLNAAPNAPLDPQGELILQHGGATNGFTAQLRIVPGRRFAIVHLTNSDDGSTLYDEISSRALRDMLGLSFDAVTPVKMTAAQLRKYEGEYTAHLDAQILRVRDGKLYAQARYLGRFPTPDAPVHGDPFGAEVELAFYDAAGERVFAASDPVLGARGEFLRDDRGRLAWLRWGGRVHALPIQSPPNGHPRSAVSHAPGARLRGSC
jgi:CubicO group peptidase (beta-lactamase class C family)